MKNNLRPDALLLLIAWLVIMVLPVYAQEKATKEECMAKVNEAITLINAEGAESAMEKIMDKNGSYAWKDSYVFCIDSNQGKMLAHPTPRFLGFPMKNYRDANGGTPFVEIIEVANSKGAGWKGYKFVEQGKPDIYNKMTYFAKVPGQDIIVCAGYYE